METNDLLVRIRQIVDEAWSTTGTPVLLSNMPRKLESGDPGLDYKEALGGRSLKSLLQENAESAGVRIVQDPAHAARVGLVPLGEDYEFAPLPSVSRGVAAADAQAFARILDAMTAEEKQSVMFPASFVARLLFAQ